MELFILDGTKGRDNPSYRGIERETPNYCEALPREHEINQLFDWYVEPTGGGPVSDLEKALRYTALLNTYFPDQQFEVVEIVKGDAHPETNATFIGFDLSDGYNSLLTWGFITEPGASRLLAPIHTLCEVVGRYFVPQLNSFRLFQTIDAATFCLRSLDALQRLSPGTYESEHGSDLREYEVVGVYVLAETGNGKPLTNVDGK